jgi:hypothetical protein
MGRATTTAASSITIDCATTVPAAETGYSLTANKNVNGLIGS